MSVIAGRSGNGSGASFGRRASGRLVAVSLLASLAVVAPQWSPTVARAQLPSYDGVDPALTASLAAQAQRAADSLLSEVSPGAESGTPPAPVDENAETVSVESAPQPDPLEALTGVMQGLGSDPLPAVDEPSGFVPGESEVVTGSPSSLTYENPDGSFTKLVFPGNVLAKNDQGEWVPFDPQPEVEGGRVDVPDARVDTSFALEGDDARVVEVSKGRQSAGFSLEGASDVPAVLTETGVRYDEILPGVDLVEHSVVDGVKEELVVAAAPASPMVFRFRVSASLLTPRVGATGVIEFVDGLGTIVFRVPEGTAWDSNTDQPEELNRVPVETRLVKDGGDWFVELAPDFQWMSDPARVYPVVVDPQFVSSQASMSKSDAWVWYQSPNTRYDGTSGTYSQWSDGFNNFASRIGYTRVNNVWHQYRTYMYFALGLPAGYTHTITSASLSADVIWVREYSTSGVITAPPGYHATIGMYKVTGDWYPGPSPSPSLTWNVQPAYNPSYIPVGVSASAELSTDLTSWVQGWDANPATNKGIMFAGLSYSTPGSDHGFTVLSAMESTTPPVLTVTYTTTPKLTDPANGPLHKSASQSVLLKWSDPDGPLTGYVDVGTDPSFAAGTYVSTSVAGATQLNLPANSLAQGETYHWRVRKQFNGQYLISTPRSFTPTNSVPSLNFDGYQPGVDGYFESDTPTITIPAATDADGDDVQYQFKACSQPNGAGDCLQSGWVSVPSWTAPDGLNWSEKYYWTVKAKDGLLGSEVSATGLTSVSVNEELPAAQWTFGSYGNGARSGNVELSSGNLTFQATDIDPASIGVDIGATRTYNSRDPRSDGLFGRGWTHAGDMWIDVSTENQDAVVHFADGSAQFFGWDGTGYAPSWGAQGSLAVDGASGYWYSLPSGLRYHFEPQPSSSTLRVSEVVDPSVTDTATDPDAVTTRFEWNEARTALVVTDVASGRAMAYTLEQPVNAYYPHVVSVALSEAAGETWTYEYAGDNLVKACSPDVDASASVHALCTEYGYTGNLINEVLCPQTKTGSAREPDPSPTNKKVLFHVAYGSGRVISEADGVGNVWNYTYVPHDPLNGSAAPVVFPDGSTADVSRLTTTVTTPGGGVTVYDFDAAQRVVRQAGPLGTEQWWQYSDTTGYLMKSTTRLAAGTAASSFATTQYTFDASGLMTQRTDPNGAIWQWAYNSFGRVTSEIDPYGYTVNTAYQTDNLHVASVTRRAAPTGSSTLTPVGHGDASLQYKVTGVSSGLGELAFAYGSTTLTPPRGLVASVEAQPIGQKTEYRYSAGGDLRWTRTGTDAQGYVYTRYTYDAVGRKLTTETSTDDTNWTLMESNQYDPAGRLVATDGPAIADAVTADVHQLRVSTVYDDAGNPLTITKSDIGGSAHPDTARTVTYHYDDSNRADRITDALGNTTDKVFDADGNVSDTYDARGTHVAITHDLAGREVSTTLKNFVEDPVGNSTGTRDVVLSSKTYDLAGRVVTSTDALGRTTTTTYDPFGMGWPTKVVLSQGGTGVNILAATTYDALGRPTEVYRFGDPTENTLLQHVGTTYDLWGRAKTVTTYDTASNGAGGGTVDRVTTNTYDVAGNVLSAVTTGGSTTSTVTNTYLPNGWLASTTTENGTTDLTTSQTYDARGRVVASTDAAGRVTTATYDIVGRAVTSTAPSAPLVTVNRDTGTTSTATGAATSAVGYNTFGEVAHAQDALGEVTTTVYDVVGRKSLVSYPSYTPPGGSAVIPTESFAYDAVGNLVSSTNRLGETTTFTFDMMNRVVRQTDPAVGTAAAGVSTFTYDDAGNRLSVTNQVGAFTEYEYDAMNQVITTRVHVRRAGGEDINVTTVVRDLAGRPIQTCQPAVNGQTSCSYASYSPMGEVLTTTDAVGNTTFASYDGLGRQNSLKDAAGHETVTGYDLAGRVSTVSHKGTNGAVVDATSYQRDGAGNVTHVDLPGGGQFNYVFDAAGRMSSVSQLKQASPAAWITVSYGYDLLGRQVSSTDGNGNQWLTTYNTLGLPQDQIEPSTPGQEAIGDRRFTTVYDAAGLVVEYQQPGGVNVAYSYDELARVTLESAAVTATSAAGSAGFGYDAAGRLTSFTAPQGDVSLSYDDRNLLISATGEGVASSFVYDARGRMTQRTDAAGVSQYLWDAADRLVADTEPLTNTTRTYTWNTSNQVTGVSYSAGGMQRAYSYDTAGRLVSDTLTGDSTTQRQSVYTYDTAGRLASETISGTTGVVGQGVNSYTYDLAGRLVSWTAPSSTVTGYGWDDSGNRTSNGAVASTYDARNRLVGSSNGDSYTWSPRGTMVSQIVNGQSSDYSFDGLGRMVTAAGVGVRYDALNRLAQRSDGAGGWVDFSYSGAGLQPVSDGSTLTARSPSGDPVATQTGNGTAVSLVADRHGDVVATFNPTAGTIAGSVEFDPFGQVTATGGVQAGTVGYQGAYTDSTSGLVDMGARWYQPSTGRFTARDTIRPMLGSPISLNMYTYANDDPLGFFDPDGHCAVKMDNRECAPTAKAPIKPIKPIKPILPLNPKAPGTGKKPGSPSGGGTGLCPGGGKKIDGEFCPGPSAADIAQQIVAENIQAIWSYINGSSPDMLSSLQGESPTYNMLVYNGTPNTSFSEAYWDNNKQRDTYKMLAERCKRVGCDYASFTLVKQGAPVRSGNRINIINTLKDAVNVACMHPAAKASLCNLFTLLTLDPIVEGDEDGTFVANDQTTVMVTFYDTDRRKVDQVLTGMVLTTKQYEEDWRNGPREKETFDFPQVYYTLVISNERLAMYGAPPMR